MRLIGALQDTFPSPPVPPPTSNICITDQRENSFALSFKIMHLPHAFGKKRTVSGIMINKNAMSLSR